MDFIPISSGKTELIAWNCGYDTSPLSVYEKRKIPTFQKDEAKEYE
ncbi:MAG: hypothetical protein RBT65_15995 [Methanolobus sp.]|nr:hypothetical protein [Methanolobus sp.]